MENNPIWGEIAPFTKVFPKKAADGRVYVFFQFVSNTYKVPSKRSPNKLINFRADCYATGGAWQALKAKELYAGRRVSIVGDLDERLGKEAFRVDVLDYENLNKFLQPNQQDEFHPQYGFANHELEF
ncbi:MAG: hypothetical protein U0Y10_17580 [Spirosomataceae bacterium]